MVILLQNIIHICLNLELFILHQVEHNLFFCSSLKMFLCCYFLHATLLVTNNFQLRLSWNKASWRLLENRVEESHITFLPVNFMSLWRLYFYWGKEDNGLNVLNVCFSRETWAVEGRQLSSSAKELCLCQQQLSSFWFRHPCNLKE